ncbi:unnamed protein product [Linum tenue]|uniref:Uncharacterized protein n=1 Tax=Linum tenue TaxID=586396 RepID=A0AAV0MXR4_9ROSI|nr:unnamed protein product [Linum tenue]
MSDSSKSIHEEQQLETPLLVEDRRHRPDQDDDDATTTTTTTWQAELVRELKRQMKVAGPLVVVSFLQYSLQLISVMFVGRLGQLALSSASMATSFAGVTGFGFMMGMGGALETLCGQAYGSAQHHHLLGLHLQRALIITTILSIPISLLWAYTARIFLFLGQDPQISRGAGLYARFLIPSILPYGFLQCQLRFLQAQNLVSPLILSTGLATVFHVGLCWALIFRLGFGNEGAALSVAVSYWVNVVVLGLYTGFSPSCRMTWTGFSRDGGRGLCGFLRLGVPSALMV